MIVTYYLKYSTAPCSELGVINDHSASFQVRIISAQPSFARWFHFFLHTRPGISMAVDWFVSRMLRFDEPDN